MRLSEMSAPYLHHGLNPYEVEEIIGHDNFTIGPSGVSVHDIFELPSYYEKVPFPLNHVDHFKVSYGVIKRYARFSKNSYLYSAHGMCRINAANFSRGVCV